MRLCQLRLLRLHKTAVRQARWGSRRRKRLRPQLKAVRQQLQQLVGLKLRVMLLQLLKRQQVVEAPRLVASLHLQQSGGGRLELC